MSSPQVEADPQVTPEVTEEKPSLILFDEYDPSILKLLEEETFEALGNLNNEPVLTSYRNVLDEIDSTPFDQLVLNPSQRILDFRAFLVSTIPAKTLVTIANSWPSAIPRFVPQTELGVKLMIKMTRESADHLKFLKWIRNCVFPFFWMKTTSNLIETTYAASLVTYKAKIHWAVLDCENNIHIYLPQPQGDLKEAYKGQTFGVRVSEDKQKVTFLGQGGNEMVSVVLQDPETSQFWQLAFQKGSVHLLSFLSKIQKPYPILLLDGIYNHISHHDTVLLRALLSKGLLPEIGLDMIIHYSFDIMSHAQKNTYFIGSVISNTFDYQDITPDSLFETGSPVLSLSKLYFRKYGFQYFQSFGLKLVKYIDSIGDVKIATAQESDAPKIEKALFTCIKLIIQSRQFLCAQISHLASMIKAYSVIHFKTKQEVITVLSNFFTGFLFECISNPQQFDPTLQIANPNTLQEFALAIKNLMHLQRFSDEIPNKAAWNMRFEKHYVSRIEDFLLSLGEINIIIPETETSPSTVSHAAPVYEIPSNDVVIEALGHILEILSEHRSDILRRMQPFNSECKLPTCLSWNFVSTISSFFRQSNDEIPEVPKIAAPIENQPSENPEIEQGEKKHAKVKKVTKNVIKGTPDEEAIIVSEEVHVEESEDGKDKKKTVKRTVLKPKE